jgi:hypothetical protein
MPNSSQQKWGDASSISDHHRFLFYQPLHAAFHRIGRIAIQALLGSVSIFPAG